MTTVTARADLSVIKARQQKTWASGSTGLATTAYQELAAAPRAEVITPADRGYDKAPRSVSQRC